MVTPCFWPLQGGVENVALALARELSGRCEVEVHTFNTKEGDFSCITRSSNPLPPRERAMGINIHRHPFFYLPALKFVSPKLIRSVRASRPDVVHIQGFRTIMNNMWLQRAVRRPFVLTAHGLYEGAERIRGSPLRPLVSLVIRNFLRGFQAVIATSEIDRPLLSELGYGPSRITVIPNGVDESKFRRVKEFVIRDGRKSILCVARFDVNKGHEDLIQALSIVERAGEDFRAYLVGHATNPRCLENARSLAEDLGLADHVGIYTDLDDAQLVDCYRSCELFVLPSHMETLPLAIIEAMHVGMPVVATAVGGVPGLVKDGVNGYLVNPGHPEALAEKMLVLLRNDAMRYEFRKRSIELVQGYNWRDVAERTLNVYEGLVAEAGSEGGRES